MKVREFQEVINNNPNHNPNQNCWRRWACGLPGGQYFNNRVRGTRARTKKIKKNYCRIKK